MTVASLLALLVAVVSCDSSDHGMTRADADVVARAGAADALVVLGRAWEPPRSPNLVDRTAAALARRLGVSALARARNAQRD